LLLRGLAACASPGAQAPEDWFDAGQTLDVVEPLSFTDVPYDFTGATPIGDVPQAPEFGTLFAEGDDLPACDGWSTSADLPVEVTGVATVLPRVYLKTEGCVPTGDPDAQSDEKHYGSFFLQDASGGIFVLGDDKNADFAAGDRVTLRVLAVAERFGLDAVSSFEVLSIERGPEPIFYASRESALDDASIAEVQRMTGTVAAPPDTFGEMTLTTDGGVDFVAQVDSELTRRGVTYAVGERLEVTGPVLYSYSTYALVVLQLGQIRTLETP
jgi:hypothetical protein